jgi:UDP-N-acetylmuramoyl-tripeptide--D-alanyl-D-alanine ligase
VEAIAWTVADITTMSGGRLVAGRADQRVDALSIDSRTVKPGDFFVAIRGERFDGHAFVDTALAAGAVGAMVATVPAFPVPVEGRPQAAIIEVPDTTRALQDAARAVRRQSGAKVVAITGSAGKTTTKELTAEFLSIRYRVFRNKGNFNNHIGLPLSLLELRARPDIAVVELGMNHPGEIRTLVGIAEPDVRVWTNVGDAHLGFFASADSIADAKAEILEDAAPDNLLVANADDPRIMSRIGSFKGRILTFGISAEADVRARGVEHRGLDGMAATVTTPAGDARLSTPLLGMGNLLNLLAALATASSFGVPLSSLVERAASLRPAAHRGELLRLPGGVTLIDDSYNSSPAALRRSLEIVQAASGSARKVAVLGEMLELGTHAQRLHEECGRAAATAGLDLLIAIGGDAARHLADGAVGAGMPAASVLYVPTSAEATPVVLQKVRAGDLVLVKGSRGIRTDVIAERLKVEFA